MEDLVSVVLPVRYVNYHWLRKSIESVLSQTYDNIELIIVNDESTLPIDDLIQEYGIKKYIKNPINKKLPYSLNRGFSLAEGKYVTWTSADNYMHPDMIKTLVDKLKSLPSDYGIVFSNSSVVDKDNKVYPRLTEEVKCYTDICSKSGDTFDKMTFNSCYWSTLGACFLYTKEIADKFKYNEDIHGAEDYDFWIRATKHFNAYFIEDKSLYYYRCHDASISSTVSGCFSVMRVNILQQEYVLNPDNCSLMMALKYYRKNVRNENYRKFLMLYNYIYKYLIKFATFFIPVKSWRKKMRNRYRTAR